MIKNKKLIITAGVILVDDKKILLVKRPMEKKIFAGAWSFPGGKLEDGESLEECAIREFKEEVGLSLDAIEKHSFQEYISDNSYTISHLFIGKTKKKIELGDDVKWFSSQDIDNINIAFDYEELIRNLITN